MIETERLILRPFSESDAEDVFEYLKKPAVNCFLSLKLDSVEEAEAEIKRRMGASEIYLAIELSIDGMVNGEDYDLQQNGNAYVIRIRNIAVYDLDKQITVKVNGEDAVTYSPLDYCYKAQQTSGNGRLVKTVKALYNYWLAASQYF